MLRSKDMIEYVQCSQCGRVYSAQQKHNVESLYVDEICPFCNARRGLYIGTDLNDFYALTDITLDSRYYEYSKH